LLHSKGKEADLSEELDVEIGQKEKVCDVIAIQGLCRSTLVLSLSSTGTAGVQSEGRVKHAFEVSSLRELQGGHYSIDNSTVGTCSDIADIWTIASEIVCATRK
jgi:hypothetical protein